MKPNIKTFLLILDFQNFGKSLEKFRRNKFRSRLSKLIHFFMFSGLDLALFPKFGKPNINKKRFRMEANFLAKFKTILVKKYKSR